MKTNTIVDIPHQLWKYLTFKNTLQLPAYLSVRYYLSWEDALWHLIEVRGLKGKTIAVPEFYCGDVMQNMRDHGLHVITYTDSSTDPVKPSDARPKSTAYTFPATDIIVIFHPVGIHNTLMEHIEVLDPSVWVIEDCVHQIIDPSKVKIMRKRHLMIDSWRKVIPLQGSMLIGHDDDLPMSPPVTRPWLYELQVITLWLLMQIVALGGWGRGAQRVMKWGYDIIGDSPAPGCLPRIFSWIRSHVDYGKIQKLKSTQMQSYHHALDPLIERDPHLFTFAHTPADWPHMRAFPLGLYLGEVAEPDSLSFHEGVSRPSGRGCSADDILARLRASGLLVRFELNDCVWSERQKVVYLPLGPEWEVEYVCAHIYKAFDKQK